MTQWGFFLSSLVWRLTVLNGQNVIGPSHGRWQFAEEHFSTEPQGLTEMGDSFCECHIFSSGKWKTEEVSKKKPTVETGGNAGRERKRQRQNILWDGKEEEGPLRPKRGIISSLSNAARPHYYIPSWYFIPDLHYVSPRSFTICRGSY